MTSSSDTATTHTGDPRLARIEAYLRRRNFLKEDDRSLARIIEEDAAEVARLGLDLDDAIVKMKRLFDEGRKGMGDPVIVDDTYEVSVREDRGIIASPFEDHYAAPKAIVEAVNLNNGKRLRFSMLGWRLIGAHGFFQGKGSPFRVEPRDLRDFFG